MVGLDFRIGKFSSKRQPAENEVEKSVIRLAGSGRRGLRMVMLRRIRDNG